MGSDETDTLPTKPDKSTSPVQEQTNVCVYPDWAAIQAYYGAGVTIPPPYYNSGVASGHPPHPYMWGPQPMMPPYGAHYAAIYSHGGIYAHPSSVSHGANSNGVPSSNLTSEPMVAPPLSIATPAKSSGNKDHVSAKKAKGLDGLAVSLGNGNAGSGTGSQSEENATDLSSSGSDGNTNAAAVGKLHRKRSRESTTPTGMNGKGDAQHASMLGGGANADSSKSLQVNSSSSGAVKTSGTISSSSMAPALELMDSSNGKTKSAAATGPPAPRAALPARDGLPSDLWIQDERELKRERRKQSNRESARRSRLRKQAETEELALKVDSLSSENLALKSEVNRITEKLETLRHEHAALKEKLKNKELGHAVEIVSSKIEEGTATLSTENLLSRVNNSDSSKDQFESGGAHENSKPRTKLHQLLESSSRTDTVAAG